MRELKDIINESFSKEYGYKIKVARDCSADDLAKLESILSKYNIVSATPWNRQPIQENPMEFQRFLGFGGSKLGPKIDQKMKSTWEGILASIFHGFWSILEAKLAPSWSQIGRAHV